MDIASEENKVTPSIRTRLASFRDGVAREAVAVPPGRFFKGVEKVWRQRYRLEPEFPLFEGHFPGQPVLPALGQALLARDAAECLRGETLSIAGIGQAKFLALIEPGAVLEILAVPPGEWTGVWLFQIFNTRNGETVEAARIKMTLRPT